MKNYLVVVFVLILISLTARAQTPLNPKAIQPEPPNGITTAEPEKATNATTKGEGISTYGGQGYDGMSGAGVPQYRAEPTPLSYIGVLGEKWETDKRGRRNSFIHEGVEMSISRDVQERKPTMLRDTIPGCKNIPY